MTSTKTVSKKEIPDNEFHIAFTMAGAISAGCYTGGVMDYFFEMMDLWERAKRGEDIGLSPEFQKLVPQHKVIVDVMGGASAGGMATAMCALEAMKKKRNPIKDPATVGGKRDNILYDSWVLLDDKDANPKDPRHSFEKLWDTKDIDESGKVQSLFNSEVIDSIAKRAYNNNDQNPFGFDHLPEYISKDFEFILSLANVRGVPLDVDFNTPNTLSRNSKDNPVHTTWEHYLLAYFKLGKDGVDTDHYLWFNPLFEKEREVMTLSTIATGAFPIGLKYRIFDEHHLPRPYIENTIAKIVTGDFSVGEETNVEKAIKPKINLSNLPNPYSFSDIDGGTINNEPYGEVLSILESKHEDKKDGYKKLGVIMIDPFPDRSQEDDKYEHPKSIIDMGGRIIRLLKNQSRVKRKEMLEGFSDQHIRGVIYPKKWIEKGNADKWPICSESFFAFGGFLDIQFRHHDFFLGRNNARSFFRVYWSFEYNNKTTEYHPIHRTWTKEMVEAFKIVDNEDPKKYYLPIIPDMNLLLEKQKGQVKKAWDYDIKDKPKIEASFIFGLQGKMEKRIGAITTSLLREVILDTKKKKQKEEANKSAPVILQKDPILEKENIEEEENQKTPYADALIDSRFAMNPFRAFFTFEGRPLISAAIRLASWLMKDNAAEGVIKFILRDLEKKDLLKK